MFDELHTKRIPAKVKGKEEFLISMEKNVAESKKRFFHNLINAGIRKYQNALLNVLFSPHRFFI